MKNSIQIFFAFAVMSSSVTFATRGRSDAFGHHSSVNKAARISAVHMANSALKRQAAAVQAQSTAPSSPARKRS